MTKTAKKETATVVANIGHNSVVTAKEIVEAAETMADIDGQRKVLNRQAAKVRQSLKDRGMDNDAFKDAYAYFKKKRHERDGYDEDHKICMDALNEADTAAMFNYQNDEE